MIRLAARQNRCADCAEECRGPAGTSLGGWSGTSGKLAHALGEKLAHRLACSAYPITTMELFLTERCTLACDYCFVSGRDPGLSMSWEVAKAAVDLLVALSAERREVNVTFFGGEPLLEFDLMQRVAAYAEERASIFDKSVRYACTTNGTVMTDDMARFGVEHGFNYLVSLDGGATAHNAHRRRADRTGSWDLVTENLSRLRHVQPWIGVRMTVNPDTVEQLAEGVRTLRRLGVNQFLIAPNLDVDWPAAALASWADQMRLVAQLYRASPDRGIAFRVNELHFTMADLTAQYSGGWGCDAGRTRMAVSCTGDLYPCSRFASIEEEGRRPFRMGGVREGITAPEIRAAVTDARVLERRECGVCRHSEVCRGPCPAVSYSAHGDMRVPHPLDCINGSLRAQFAEDAPLAPS